MIGSIRKAVPWIAILCALSQIVGCEKPTKVDWDTLDMVVADDSKVPTALAERYRRDAETLALRYLHDISNGNYEGIEISRYIIDVHYFSLIHIYNAVNITARDSVVTIYNIHSNNVPDTREMVLGLQAGSEWIDSWRQGQRLTGFAGIDSLMVKYELSLIELIPPQLLNFEVALIRSNRALNIEALAKLFEEVEGIRFAERNALEMSISNNILRQLLSDHFLIEYKFWWDDLGIRYWTFKVYKHGKVEFVGARGSTASSLP